MKPWGQMVIRTWFVAILALIVCQIVNASTLFAASELRRGSVWDSPLNQPDKTNSEKTPSEEDLVKEAKDKLRESGGQKREIPSDLRVEFDKAVEMPVSEYLKSYAHTEKESEYIIGGLDILSVRIYGEPELSRDDLRVSTDGHVTMPLIGRLKVNEMNTHQVEKNIEKRYRDGGFLRDPQVTVQIKEYKSSKVLVMGAVKTPGTYSLEGNERLMEVLAKAGGIQFDSSGDVAANSIRILRQIKAPNKPTIRVSMGMDLESLTKGQKPEYNIRLNDNDVIYVPEAPRFFVTGEVRNPGRFKLKDKPISVVEAITMAGGLTDKASGNSTRVVRIHSGKEETITVKVSDVLGGDKNKDIQVKADDVIVVPQSLF